MKVLGLEFAPWKLPLERRLQTLAISYYAFLLVPQGVTCLIFVLYLAFFTRYYYIAIALFVWYWYDRKTGERGGRRSEWIRNWALWKWMRDYFPVRMIKTSDLDPNKNYICGIHPHGIISAGSSTCFASEATNFSKIYPGITPHVVTLQVHFKMPIHREIIFGMGCASVSQPSIDWILTNKGKGQMVCIVIGGAKEALDAHPGFVKLTLKNRKGFVRRALKNGASLVPVFAFGENEIYRQIPNPPGSIVRKVQDAVTRCLGVSPPLIIGRGIFQYTIGMIPHRKPIDVIVGKPIDVEKIEDATQDDVDRVHKKYLDELKVLFDQHKNNYEQYRNIELEFV